MNAAYIEKNLGSPERAARIMRALGITISVLVASLAFGHGCGGGGDTPSPTTDIAPDASPRNDGASDSTTADNREEIELLLTVPENEASRVLPGLSQPVQVIRTEAGVPHIYAFTRQDLGRTLGFLVAQDRFFVMDLQRRLALGTLSELLGDTGLQSDQEARGVGQRRVTERLVEHMSPEMREYLQAFAEGINYYIELVAAEELPPPSELDVAAGLLGADAPADLMSPWDVQSLAAMVTVIMYETNFETGDVGRDAKVRQHDKLYEGGEANGDLRREGFFEDILGDVRSIFPDSSASGFGLEEGTPTGVGSASGSSAERDKKPSRFSSGPRTAKPQFRSKKGKIPSGLVERLANRLERFDRKIQRNRIAGFGSNAWAVSGDNSTDGSSLVAGDGHLQLSVPSLMYQIALDTSLFGGGDIHQIGLLLTGLPLLAVGTNGQVAWSQVNPVLDVTDWYREEIRLDDSGRPQASRFQGAWKDLIALEESYTIADVPALGSVGRTETWTRWTTFDGRVLADIEGRPANPEEQLSEGEALVNMQGDYRVPGDIDGDTIITAVSFDYNAFDATQYIDTLDKLGRTDSVYAFREATRGIVGSGLFSAVGDSAGNILFTSYQGVPCRTYLQRKNDGRWEEGSDPSLLLDGTVYGGFTLPMKEGVADESRGADPYQCIIPFEEMPQAINPARGFVATANNDPGEITTDGNMHNDLWYVGGPWSSVRVNTINRELQEAVSTKGADVEKMAEIQGNHDSRLGEIFAPYLLEALAQAKALMDTNSEARAPFESRMLDIYSSRSASFEQVFERLDAWSKNSFTASSGVKTFYNDPSESEKAAAVATMIFNAYFPRFKALVWDDEPVGAGWIWSGSRMQVRAIMKFLEGRGEGNPKNLASWNAETGEAVFFDILGTEEIERSDELMIKALSETLDFLESEKSAPGAGGFGTPDMSEWLWGLRHQAKFESLLAEFLGDDPMFGFLADLFSITTKVLPLGDDVAPGDPRHGIKWFPRGGDNWSVDAANPGFSGTNFTHTNGPVMRMVIALKDGRVSGQNIIPGGQSGLTSSPHFSDQAKLWLANDTFPLRFHIEDVVAGATAREVYSPE